MGTAAIYSESLAKLTNEAPLSSRQTITHFTLIGTADRNLGDSFVATVSVKQLARDLYNEAMNKIDRQDGNILSYDDIAQVTARSFAKKFYRKGDSAYAAEFVVMPWTTADIIPPRKPMQNPRILFEQIGRPESELNKVLFEPTYWGFPNGYFDDVRASYFPNAKSQPWRDKGKTKGVVSTAEELIAVANSRVK